MLETLLADGWDYHADQSERLAGELEAAAGAPAPDELLVRFVRLSTHTLGEHLGDWPRACRLAERAIGGRAPAAATARAWLDLAVARQLAGEVTAAVEAELAAFAALDDLRPALIEARLMLAAALIGCGRRGEAVRIHASALSLARSLGEAAPARAIAVTSNNLAADLSEAASRTPDEDAAMRLAAEAAHEYWKKAGDWTNDERALQLRARVETQLGAPERGLELAAEGLAIIAANAPRPIDAAFLHLVRVRAFAALGDESRRKVELALADAAADRAPRPDLKAWYAEARAKLEA